MAPSFDRFVVPWRLRHRVWPGPRSKVKIARLAPRSVAPSVARAACGRQCLVEWPYMGRNLISPKGNYRTVPFSTVDERRTSSIAAHF